MSKFFPIEVLSPRHCIGISVIPHLVSLFTFILHPAKAMLSILSFSVANCLPRENLLQKVHWLFLILVLCFFFQSSLALRCPQRPIACDMVALGIHQSFHTTPSVDSRVLTAIKPLVLAYEDASRMDFGVE